MSRLTHEGYAQEFSLHHSLYYEMSRRPPNNTIYLHRNKHEPFFTGNNFRKAPKSKYCTVGSKRPLWSTITSDFLYCTTCFTIILQTPGRGIFFHDFSQLTMEQGREPVTRGYQYLNHVSGQSITAGFLIDAAHYDYASNFTPHYHYDWWALKPFVNAATIRNIWYKKHNGIGRMQCPTPILLMMNCKFLLCVTCESGPIGMYFDEYRLCFIYLDADVGYARTRAVHTPPSHPHFRNNAFTTSLPLTHHRAHLYNGK